MDVCVRWCEIDECVSSLVIGVLNVDGASTQPSNAAGMVMVMVCSWVGLAGHKRRHSRPSSVTRHRYKHTSELGTNNTKNGTENRNTFFTHLYACWCNAPHIIVSGTVVGIVSQPIRSAHLSVSPTMPSDSNVRSLSSLLTSLPPPL